MAWSKTAVYFFRPSLSAWKWEICLFKKS